MTPVRLQCDKIQDQVSQVEHVRGSIANNRRLTLIVDRTIDAKYNRTSSGFGTLPKHCQQLVLPDVSGFKLRCMDTRWIVI